LATSAVALRAPRESAAGRALLQGLTTLYLSLIVLLPLAALVWQAEKEGSDGFWEAVSGREAVAAVKLTLIAAFLIAGVNAVMGTVLAWVLVRDRFVGKGFVNALIDLPFALPTIVAGLTLLALYGPRSSIANLAYTRAGIVLALLFVTLPFVVRTVQPTLIELDREMEDAAASLGAGSFAIFSRIVLPNIVPAVLSGVALAFARAIGEFGAVVLISGNLPFKTEVASVYIFGQIQSNNPTGAAAISVLLLGISLAVLLVIGGIRRYASRHDG
jgi:sulfate transport system permease protein